jgi:hypothetical protein
MRYGVPSSLKGMVFDAAIQAASQSVVSNSDRGGNGGGDRKYYTTNEIFNWM